MFPNPARENISIKYSLPSEEIGKLTIYNILGMKAEDLVRKKEKLFKEKYEGKKISNTEWIKILHKNPILIERPIFVKDGKAIIGRPVERVLEII